MTFACCLALACDRGDDRGAEKLAAKALERSAAESVVVLGAPEWEYPRPFAEITAFTEVDSNTVFIADRLERRIFYADLTTGHERVVGRRGPGPGEWLRIERAVLVAGDTILAVDDLKHRLLLIIPSGIAEVPKRADGTMRTIEGSGSAAYLRGIDDRRAMYYQVVRPRAERVLEGKDHDRHYRDIIVREDIRTQRIDTLASVRIGERFARITGASPGGGGWSSTITVAPFQPADAWGVARDGRVTIVRSPEYTTEWIDRDGRRGVGPAIPYERIAPSERQMEITRREVSQAGLSAPSFPAAVPPVLHSWSAVVVAPDGEVWIERMGADSKRTGIYDVIDSRGVRVRRVNLPERTLLLALGRDVMYVARSDSDDLVHLGRYRRPGRAAR
jgi:hypothetical protein